MPKSKLTPLGKELRKVRVDYEESVADMAKRLDISPCYLSVIANGGRHAPTGLVDKVIMQYNLDETRAEKLRDAELQTIKEYKVNLEGMGEKQRRLIMLLAGSRRLSDAQIDRIFEITAANQ